MEEVELRTNSSSSLHSAVKRVHSQDGPQMRQPGGRELGRVEVRGFQAQGQPGYQTSSPGVPSCSFAHAAPGLMEPHPFSAMQKPLSATPLRSNGPLQAPQQYSPFPGMSVQAQRPQHSGLAVQARCPQHSGFAVQAQSAALRFRSSGPIRSTQVSRFRPRILSTQRLQFRPSNRQFRPRILSTQRLQFRPSNLSTQRLQFRPSNRHRTQVLQRYPNNWHHL